MIIKGRRLSEARKKVVASKARPHTLHVINSDKGWAIKREGTKKASLVLDTKAGAIARSKKFAGVKNVVIHKKDGTVERWNKLPK
ncbi:DUF2188 domain-containing protein [Chloroflexota bacterium]